MRCDDCQWWKEAPEMKDEMGNGGFGVCFGNPPVQMLMGYQVPQMVAANFRDLSPSPLWRTLFPMTHMTWGCGRWLRFDPNELARLHESGEVLPAFLLEKMNQYLMSD